MQVPKAYVERLDLVPDVDKGLLNVLKAGYTSSSSDHWACCSSVSLSVQVPEAYVERLDLVPDVDKGLLNVLVHGSPAAKGLKVRHCDNHPCCITYSVV